METVVHAAFFTNPRRDASYAHELESIGTLNLAAAAAAAGVRHVVLRSFTAVYGARGQNPSFLTEEHAAAARARASAGCATSWRPSSTRPSFARRYPGDAGDGAALRAAARARASTPSTRGSSTKRVVPVLMGYDPLLQLLHPDDALDAAVAGARARRRRGVLQRRARAARSRCSPRSTWRRRSPCPCRTRLAYPAADLCGRRGLGEAPGGFVDYARYPFVADGEKARRELGFDGPLLQPRGARWPTCAIAIPTAAGAARWRRRESRRMSDTAKVVPIARGRRRAAPAEADGRAGRARAAGARARDQRGSSGRRGARTRPAGGARARLSRARRGLDLGEPRPGSSARSTSPGTPRRRTSSAPTRGSRETLVPFFEFLYTMWWRVEAAGIEHMPARGAGAHRRQPLGRPALRRPDGQPRDPPRASGAARTAACWPSTCSRCCRSWPRCSRRAARCAPTRRTPSACCARASWSACSRRA